MAFTGLPATLPLVEGGSARLGLPMSPGAYPRGERRGNPNLGRETEAQKKRRMGTWREQNLLMKEEALHVEGSVLEALGISSYGNNDFRDDRGRYGSLDILRALDNDKPTFWR